MYFSSFSFSFPFFVRAGHSQIQRIRLHAAGGGGGGGGGAALDLHKRCHSKQMADSIFF